MAYTIIPPTTYRYFMAYKQDMFWGWNIYTLQHVKGDSDNENIFVNKIYK